MPHEMRELVHRTHDALQSKTLPPLLVIANFIFEFLAIHPFQDGNGRLSRLLTQLLMLQQGYLFVPFASHEAVVESMKIEYYEALNKTQQSRKTKVENIVPRLKFFLSAVFEQAKKAISISKQEDIEPYLSPSQLTVRRLLQQHGQATRKQLAAESGVPYDTVGQVLQKLVRMKKVAKSGSTRGTVYRVVG